MKENKKSKDSYDLLIVESPAKAKTIQKYLDGMNIKVIASKGHIKELPPKKLGVDLESFDIELVTIDGKEDVIDDIKKLAKNAARVFLGSDPDREGEAISYHLRDEIKHKKVFRVLFHEITKDAIKKALASAGEIDEKKYESQKTRRILDRLVGYKISPILWEKIASGLSAGRVQSVAVRLIVDREDEIQTFVPEKRFEIQAKLQKDDIVFDSKYYGETEDKKVDLTEKEESLVKQILDDVKGQPFVTSSILTKEKKQMATPPFTTSKLQQEASSKLKFSSKKTMEIAQKLYEGISLGEKGSQGLITYMRTDSVRTEPNALNAVRAYIEKTYGKEYIPDSATIHKKKKADVASQDAHEAIRPTNLDNTPESIKPYLDLEEFKLYQLIWNKFVASQMAPAVLDQTIVFFNVNSHYFRSTGSVVKFQGFKVIYSEATSDDSKEDENESKSLPKLDKDESLVPVKGPDLIEKWTVPPPRFTESTLIKELEERGIGRPSTYATIISNITDRKYIEKNEGKFKPTNVGSLLCETLVQHFPKVMDISFTAKMEEDLDLIEEGKLDWKKLIVEWWGDFFQALEKAKAEMKKIKQDEPRKIDPKNLTGIKCIKCDGEYQLIKSSKGEFLGCSNYPKCTSTQQFQRVKGKIKLKKQDYHTDPCPKCGKRLIIRDGKFGKYYSCEGWPECKHKAPVTTGIKCPECNNGEYVKKLSKKGNTFWGCSNFPTCHSVLWNEPIAEKCISCVHEIVTAYEKDGKTIVECPKCKHKEEF